MSSKILVVEDDLLFAETLIDLLDESGYDVVHSKSGEEALDQTYKKHFDLYLLDINLPLLDGLELLRELRAVSDKTPAIYITSHQDSKVLSKAFSYGCDDYVKKPFETDELLARIKARLRDKELLVIDDIALDEIHKTVKKGDKALHLSLKEYELLRLFIKNINQVVTKEMIIDELWSPSESVSDGAIRVYINRIKSECKSLNIENIRGIGYRLVC